MVTLVVLPGMDGTGSLHDDFIAALGPAIDVKVVAYPATGAADYAQLESIARAAIPADGPFVILGESFSGPIAVSIATSNSPRLKGLVLCCSFVRNPRPAFSRAGALLRFLPIALAPFNLLNRLLLGRYSTSGSRKALAEALAQVPASTIRSRLKEVLSVDVASQLSEVKVPILYLKASCDQVVPPSASLLIAQINPAVEVAELEGPHLLLQSAPDQAAHVVRSFVQKLTTDTGSGGTHTITNREFNGH